MGAADEAFERARLASIEPDLPSIGSFDSSGATSAPVGDEPEYGTVTYYDKPIRVVLDPLSLELTLEEFMDIAAGLEGTEDPRAFGAVRAFLRAMIHPEDFNTFWRLVRTHRQGLERQMEFGKWLVEEVTGHPIGQQSGSGAGLLPTVPNSEDVSHRVQRRLEEDGRPDLALVVVRRREASSLG